ncbi:uncharacterized protein LOC119684627 [Teleopsis dalmanni]|uniref:uncharacterized protein LOC119684627 n=1 Tax=Teleopsis dalmanni TaxID=139649 RepID=UPI0018CEA8C8|nr:uncharacterized protein LOC119684627 [Teleopsis dalmanni]
MSENNTEHQDETSQLTSTSNVKTKRNWFHSLTRRKKSQSATTTPTLDSPEPQLQNNNNEPVQNTTVTDAVSATTGAYRKKKDIKNVFTRFRKTIHSRFYSLRRGDMSSKDDGGGGGTTDATYEFVTQSSTQEPHMGMLLSFSFSRGTGYEEPEMIPFTHDYKQFIEKKWLHGKSGPNRVMYKASSEMLSQVWYWGDISRRDAQRQLTDKPTGTFLVRDSETSECQFTLSFRIVNVTLHYRLEYRDNYWRFEELQYESLVEMIEDILYRCTNDNFVCFVKVPNEMQPPFPVILKYPLSRYYKMPLLQDLCRRVIQRSASVEEISNLPIPPKLQEYLKEKPELVFQS